MDADMSEQELQVGDEIITNATYGKNVVLHRITKITEKMYVCQNIRFWKDGLRIVGAGQFEPFKGRIPTEKDRINVRIQKAMLQLNKFVVTEQNVDEVERFLNRGDMYASESALRAEERHFSALQAHQDRLESIREGWVSFHEPQVWNELLTVEDGGYDLIESHHVGGTPEAINTLCQFIARLKSERSLSTDDGLIAVGTLAVSIVTQAVSKEAERLADQTMEREE